MHFLYSKRDLREKCSETHQPLISQICNSLTFCPWHLELENEFDFTSVVVTTSSTLETFHLLYKSIWTKIWHLNMFIFPTPVLSSSIFKMPMLYTEQNPSDTSFSSLSGSTGEIDHQQIYNETVITRHWLTQLWVLSGQVGNPENRPSGKKGWNSQERLNLLSTGKFCLIRKESALFLRPFNGLNQTHTNYLR